MIAISGENARWENGDVWGLPDLVRELHTLPPTLFVKRNAADFVSELDAVYSSDKSWQWRASVNEREICRPDGIRVATRVTTAIHYFGWKGHNFHKIIDPVTMYGHGLDTILPGDDPILDRLLRWGVTLRDFCDQNGMQVRPTIGGISVQFLTDQRFYPNPRRKVPAVVNARAREEMPGNHYMLTVHPTPNHEFVGLYLDQHRAHHHHARTTALPDADHLYAYGNFVNLEKIVVTDVPRNFHGLYCLDLKLPPKSRQSHWITKSKKQFVFSNELPHLLDDGYKVIGIRAAWGSFMQDAGIARFATFADEQLDRYGDPPWLKPLLLATYGVLAARRTYGETIFKLARRGQDVTLNTGHGTLSGKLVQHASVRLEPRIVNVLHRGMIEAATRSESVGLAQHLTYLGHRVLSIYADAVIIEQDDDRPLPTLPTPWRLKQTLNHLQFINRQAFTSGEMTKLPGVGRELKQYRQHAPGSAPQKKLYDSLSGQPVKSTRRI